MPMTSLQSMYQLIVEAASEGIWVLDTAGRTLFANAAMSETLGYAPEEMAALTLFDVLDEPGQTQAVEHLRQVRAEPTPERIVECSFLRKDGDRIWTLVSHSPLRGPTGDHLGTIYMVSDITGRKELEVALRDSEQQLAESQQVARLGSWEWDVVADVVRWSDGLYRVMGIDPEGFQATFNAYMEHVHPDDRAMVAAHVGGALEGADTFEFTHRVLGSDQRMAWLESRGQVVRDANGTPVRMFGTAMDVSPAKRAEEALRETSARYRLLQEMAAAANGATTLDGAVRVAMDALGRHTGWQPGRVLMTGDAPAPGEPDRRKKPEAPDEPADALLAQVARTGSPAWADGDRSAAEPRARFAFPVMAGTDVACVLEFVVDDPLRSDEALLETVAQVATQLGRVAERARTAEELSRARDAAMESSRLKSQFLATMSHEIRTPMNGVIGLTDLLLGTALDERQRRYAEGVRSAGESLLALVSDILDLSKIEAGRLQLEEVDFDLCALVHETGVLLDEAARRKGVELVVTCADDLPVGVRGDRVRLGQVLMNLGSNAVKFTEHGTVEIKVRPVDALSAGEMAVRFDVVDTGIGIAPEARASLFEPFTQGDASTTRHYGGTGLGLAISRQLVTAMGGALDLVSQPDHGSTFWFTVPLRSPAGDAAGGADPVAGASAADGTPPPCAARRPILVVEDNPANQMVAEGLLDRLGYAVEIAADGETALRQLERTRYTAVLMDCQLPNMDGFDTTRALRRQEDPSRRTPVIAVTAAAVDGDRERCLRAGMDDYVSKPISPEVLADVLARWAPCTAGPPPPDPAPARPGHGAIDPDRIALLRRINPADPSLLPELIGVFLDSAAGLLQQLRQAVEDGDSATLELRAHTLKGSALNLGARTVSELCGRLETLGRQRRTADAAALTAQLADELDRATEALWAISGPGTASPARPADSRRPGQPR